MLLKKLAGLAHLMGVPVSMTLDGSGGLSRHRSDLSWHAWECTAPTFANMAINNCDVLFAIGSPFPTTA